MKQHFEAMGKSRESVRPVRTSWKATTSGLIFCKQSFKIGSLSGHLSMIARTLKVTTLNLTIPTARCAARRSRLLLRFLKTLYSFPKPPPESEKIELTAKAKGGRQAACKSDLRRSGSRTFSSSKDRCSPAPEPPQMRDECKVFVVNTDFLGACLQTLTAVAVAPLCVVRPLTSKTPIVRRGRS